MTDTDRRVHAVLRDNSEIVRYDRAGKWYREWPASAGIPRRMLSLHTAVTLANSADVAVIHMGLPGGGMFDHQIRSREETP